MVEELKLAIKIDDATIEQSLLKQFANAQKMANKVVLDFKNVNFDDKQIEAKFKEMQKKAGQNPIDFSISGNTLDMLGQIDKRLTEIFSIGKGKSFIDSSSTVADIDKIENKINELNKKINTSFDTKNKTEAYNQLKKYADAFKDYYNNEEAMASESGTKAAYAYYKAYEEALKKEVAQSKLEKVTVDFDINDKFFDKNRIVSDRIKEYANYKKYGSDNDLLEEISSLKNKLFDFNSAYSQVKEKLGQAAITPEIIKSVERYVELLDKARFLEQLNDPDDNDTIKSHRAMAQVSLDDALFNAQEQSYKYTKSLRQQEEQLTSTVEAEQKLAEVQKETTSNSVTSDNSQIEELKSDIQEVKTELGDVKDRISSIESNGFENVRDDVEKTKESVKELNSELAEMKSNLSSTPQESNISSGRKDAFHDQDVSASVESATNSIKEENNVLEQNTKKVKENTQAKEQNANVNLNGYDKRLDSYQGKINKYDTTIKRFEDGGWSSDTYLKNVQAVRDAVKQYATLLDHIKTNQNGIASDEDIQNLDKYEKKIKDTIATVTNMSASEKGYNFVSGQKELDKIHKLLNENSKMSSEAKAKIKAYYKEIESGNPSMSLDKIHGEIMKIYNAEVEAGRAGKSFIDTLKNSGFHQFAAQMAGMFSFYDIINGVKQVASTVIDLNTQITDLAKVSEATSSQIYDDFSSYADIAKDIGGTISDTISATADLSRNGYNIPDSKELARVALLYKNVGDGIDIDAANESLISTLRGFKMEADEAEKIIDVFNNVSNNEPIDSGGIGEALQRSAASFNAANTSLQESVALISTTNSVIQNPEKVGNMWKVVSMRIRSATSELEQAGEDTDGLVTSTADLQKMIKAMTGYDILESDGKTFKSIYDIVLNISKVWNNLSDLDQSSLLQALAGKQQSNALAAALSNPELLEKSYQEAMDSAGSAAEEEKKYQQSVQYSIDQTKAKLEELSADLLSSDFLKGAIDTGSKLIEVLDGIVKSGNAIPTLLTAIGAALSFKNVGEWNYISKFHSNNIICFIV
jgi:TP901 family phage tail tape measure protein